MKLFVSAIAWLMLPLAMLVVAFLTAKTYVEHAMTLRDDN